MSEKSDALIKECAALGLAPDQGARLLDAYFAVVDERVAARIRQLADSISKSLEGDGVVKPDAPAYPKGTRLIRDATGNVVRVVPPPDAA